MLSKCANPECSQQFRYLYQGKIFRLTPTPEVEAITQGFFPSLYERFWLCERCCQETKVIWNGERVQIVSIPKKASCVERTENGETTVGRRRHL
jgi:hypothetical protein